MADGTHLAACIWLPEDAEKKPVPAILEYIPYRKDDGTALRDNPIHEYFAGHGYASVRVDMRGSGDSDGLLLDEYLPQEQLDAVEVITWLAVQPWCSGSVGMMGKSWGGFNSLQVAARRPPELKAIITAFSTDDRYNDDCHYMGGCILGSDMLSWASIMLSYNALPPDPSVVGERWREMWFNRMENTPPFIENWLSHQTRDEFWKQGSVIEDYGHIQCPVYVIGGWVDPYTNSIPRLLEGLKVPRKGLIGPWAHTYPHTGIPQPAIGFLQECLRWWDYWLKGIETNIMAEPMLKVWMPDPRTPEPLEEDWPGHWMEESGWPSKNSSTKTLWLGEGLLAEDEPENFRLTITGDQTNGKAAGVWCPYGNTFGFPIDQGIDDETSLTFNAVSLENSQEIFGFPKVNLAISVDQPKALLAIRLCDIDSNGVSRLVSWGLLNLTHYKSHEKPEPLIPGKIYQITTLLNFTAYNLPPGHHWRLAISPTYWPHAWPSPQKVQLTLHLGATCSLVLPIHLIKPKKITANSFEEPEGAPSIEKVFLRKGNSFRKFLYNEIDQQLTMVDTIDDGRIQFQDGLIFDNQIINTYSINEENPTSAKVECIRQIEIQRGDWDTSIRTVSTMTSDEDFFHLSNHLTANEGLNCVLEKSWFKIILRNLV